MGKSMEKGVSKRSFFEADRAVFVEIMLIVQIK